MTFAVQISPRSRGIDLFGCVLRWALSMNEGATLRFCIVELDQSNDILEKGDSPRSLDDSLPSSRVGSRSYAEERGWRPAIVSFAPAELVTIAVSECLRASSARSMSTHAISLAFTALCNFDCFSLILPVNLSRWRDTARRNSPPNDDEYISEDLEITLA